MASSFLTRTIFSRNKKVFLLELQLARRKKASCSMVHYLSDKLDAAESFGKIGREISEDEIKELIFAGLPAEQYGNYIQEIQGHSLMVIASKLVKFEKEVIHVREEVFEARRRRGSDRKIHRDDITVIMAVVLTLIFWVGYNPSDFRFEPFHKHSDCHCEGSGPRKVCSCTPFLFLIFESIIVAGFTVALLMVARMTRDFRLYGWIWASLAFVALAFGLSIVAITPWMFRRTMMYLALGTVLTICSLIRYWRSFWCFLKLLGKKVIGGVLKLIGGMKLVCAMTIGGFKVACAKTSGGMKKAWNFIKARVVGARVPPVVEVPV